MKLLPFLLGCFTIMATVCGARAAAPSTNAAPAAPAPATARDKKPAPPAKPMTNTHASPVVIPPSHPVELKFDDYLKDLADKLKLTDDEKKEIESYYLADGTLLKNILNNDSLQPLQKSQQVSDLRDTRNAKINTLLQDADRQQTFLKVEAQYRVALTELAANGELVPAPPPPPAPAATNAAPAQPEKPPGEKSAAK
jgi:hypothetical protein